MCVPASQKPMQSARDLPPPPGLLWADSLGLALPAGEEPGDRASDDPPEAPPPTLPDEVPEEPPLVANWLGKGSDIGDSGGTVPPGSAVDGEVGVVVAGAPAGGASPPDGVDDDDVEGTDDTDGAAGAAGGAGTLRRVEGKLVLGAEG